MCLSVNVWNKTTNRCTTEKSHVDKSLPRAQLIKLSVEEENLASIPFAVLESRVGKRVGKIDIKGRKVLSDGTEVRVLWQVRGNTELGLPTEQDLDIFVALGVLTFQSSFSKTVSFTGRELAKILNIGSVHGRFYQRLKLAMDRFIPLRFRAIMETDHHEDVKWLNVFQEASFSLDRTTGRCTGTVTWTDKLIQAMDSGFFRLLDAGRYMELDGITAKHLYRYLTVAFEQSDVIIIDARKLASEHLGILNTPRYFSRLMQPLEPAFEQLIAIEVLSSYHVVSAEDWTIALHRHPAYEPERKALLQRNPEAPIELKQSQCKQLLEQLGIPSPVIAGYVDKAETIEQVYAIDRAARLCKNLIAENVLPHVAVSFLRKALDAGAESSEGRELLDWCEIGLELCREKKQASQRLKNPGGFITKLVKDPESRSRFLTPEKELAWKHRFLERERTALEQQQEDEQCSLVLDYEEFRQQFAKRLFDDLTEERKQSLRREKSEHLRHQSRLDRISADRRDQEIDALILQDFAKKATPPFEKWRLRRRARQAVLPFEIEPQAALLF
jgi:hypothetical protein